MFYRPRVGDYYKQYTCRAREALLDKFNCSKFLKQVQLLFYKHTFCVFITGIATTKIHFVTQAPGGGGGGYFTYLCLFN